MSDLYLYGIYSCCEQFLSYKQHQMELQVSLHFQDIVRWLLQSTNLPPLHSSIQIFWILVWAKISLFIIFSSILYFKTSATNTTHQQTMWFEVLEQVALQSLTQSVWGLFKSLNLSMNKYESCSKSTPFLNQRLTCWTFQTKREMLYKHQRTNNS